MDDIFEQLMSEENNKLHNRIIEKLEEGGLPANWWTGRQTNNHTMQSKEIDRKKGPTNFERSKEVSGQPDLEEHHGDYPDEVLNVSVGEFLDTLKSKDENLYHSFEDVIDKFVGDDDVNESSMSDIDLLADESKDFKSFIKTVKLKYPDIKTGKKALIWLYDVFNKKKNESVNEGQFKNLPIGKDLTKISDKEKINLIQGKGNIIDFQVPDWAKERRNFWQVISLGKIYKKKQRDGEVQYFLPGKMMPSPPFKSIKDLLNGVLWDSMERRRNFNESIESKKKNETVNELASFTVDDIVPNAIPNSQMHNKELHQDLAKALNVIFKKHNINISVK